MSYSASSSSDWECDDCEHYVPPEVVCKCDAAEQWTEGRHEEAHRESVLALVQRQQCAQRQLPIAEQYEHNDDINDFPCTYLGSFHKSLPHGPDGMVDVEAFCQLVDALNKENAEEAEKALASVRCATGTCDGDRYLLVNPMAAFSTTITGANTSALVTPPAPKLRSDETASEMIELYGQAALRDVPWVEFESDERVQKAIDAINKVADAFKGPKNDEGKVTVRTVFRGNTAGDLRGPYLSQFLVRPYGDGLQRNSAKYRFPPAGSDYMTNYDAWLSVQNGCVTEEQVEDQQDSYYLCTPRALAEYVHRDYPTYPYGGAALQLLQLGCPPSPENPYNGNSTQVGFVTFGVADIFAMLGEVSSLALKAAWFNKWRLHLRARPEYIGGLVENTRRRDNVNCYELPQALIDSNVYDLLNTGNRLLPQAYPEGSPTHPSLPAGHSTVAGACSTILKALFDESFVLNEVYVPSADGSELLKVEGETLTVGGELDKLASNISIARDWAGVHYRADGDTGTALGEEIAVRYLKDKVKTYGENFKGFAFTRRDGTRELIRKDHGEHLPTLTSL